MFGCNLNVCKLKRISPFRCIKFILFSQGQYHPSYLLCPETYIFQPIEKCKPKLDIAKYHRLEEDLTKGL